MSYSIDMPQPSDPSHFEFLVLGDTGDTDYSSRAQAPQQAVAEYLAADAALPGTSGRGHFVLHLGDVVYMTGEKRLYDRNFLKPYASLLCPDSTVDNMVFRLPFLPIPGNHDYYDLGGWVSWLSRVPLLGSAVRGITRDIFSFSFPKGGSDQGRAFMEAFVDQKADTKTAGLPYSPGNHTRIPNRYYKFTFGCCDFFMLDSNTLDAPPPWKGDGEDIKLDAKRRIKSLEEEARTLESKLKEIHRKCEGQDVPPDLDPEECAEPNVRDLSNRILDVQRELALEKRRLSYSPEDYDAGQIEWLKAGLDESARERPDSWRIVCMHHPLYTAIGNHCEGADVRAVRANLLGLLRDRVHLVLSGHSHAFEWLRSDALPTTGLIVSGGGGQVSLRRSILDPAKLPRHRDRYSALRSSGVTEYAAAGRGPAALDGRRGSIYHYLKIAASADSLLVKPIGVRRVREGYRREDPMPVFHASDLPKLKPPWQPRPLNAIRIQKNAKPEAVMVEG